MKFDEALLYVCVFWLGIGVERALPGGPLPWSVFVGLAFALSLAIFAVRSIRKRATLSDGDRRILEELFLAERELFGTDIVKAGAASRYNLYVRLNQLENRGLVFSREVEDTESGLSRTCYKITERGRIALEHS